MTKELDLEAMGVANQDEIVASAFARVLLLGPAKGGKTTAIATTAPKPLILNCDTGGATVGAANLGGKFLQIDVRNSVEWKSAIGNAKKLIDAGLVKTVAVDTISLLSDSLLDELSTTHNGYEIWGNLQKLLTQGIKKLCGMDAHLFVVAHLDPTENVIAGQLPLIGGKSKVRIPTILDDWIMLDVDPDKPEGKQRTFLLGPQKNWSHGGRNIKKTTQIPADVGALFEELGIKP